VESREVAGIRAVVPWGNVVAEVVAGAVVNSPAVVIRPAVVAGAVVALFPIIAKAKSLESEAAPTLLPEKDCLCSSS
jgi:hypothetical protein